MSGSTRWLVGVLVVVGLLVVVGVVAAMGSQPRTYAEDSPEYTVQQYVRAVADRDTTKALSYMSADLIARCDSLPRDPISNRGSSNIRATLDEVTRRDTTAVVRVRITESYGEAPFGGGESNQDVTFELMQASDGWWFTEAPWPLYCPPKPVR